MQTVDIPQRRRKYVLVGFVSPSLATEAHHQPLYKAVQPAASIVLERVGRALPA